MGLAALLEWIARNTTQEEPEQERELIRAEQHLSDLDRRLAIEESRRERQAATEGDRRAE